MKILVVDDDGDLRAILGFALRDAGFVVVEAASVETGRIQFEAERPDLVVLDLALGGREGYELLPDLRRDPKVSPAVLVLSVRSTEEDVVRALDLGADDYLTKPFSPRTLLARVRALLRRRGEGAPEPLRIGDVELDLERRTVAIGGGEPVRLTPRELRLLQLLVARAGQVVATERLLVHVWGGRGEGERHLLKQLVHRLRQKIEADPSAPSRLLTEAGEGYRLEIRR